MKPTGAGDELRWTAACYVLGELSLEEMARFEATLQESQAAREAVAEAVALLQAAALPVPLTAAPRQPWIVPAAAAAIALCAFVGIAAYLAPAAMPLADAARVQQRSHEGGQDAWLLDLPQLLEEQTVVADAAADELDEIEALVPAAAEEGEGDIPSWLILATSKEGMP